MMNTFNSDRGRGQRAKAEAGRSVRSRTAMATQRNCLKASVSAL